MPDAARHEQGFIGAVFTGIVQAIGTIAALEPRGTDVHLQVATGTLDVDSLAPGDSICVSGVCLTVVARGDGVFAADVSGETLHHTILGRLRTGDQVNLEPALTLGTPLGGHLVTGHVDGVGELIRRYADGRSERMHFRTPAELSHYIARKGSICIDGISLTVNHIDDSEFDVNIVPHTLAQTTMASFSPGRHVNLEVDIIARYLERLLLGPGPGADEPGGDVTRELLARRGFIRD